MNHPDWVDAAAADDLPTHDVLGVDVAGHSLALYTVDGQVYASDNTCTHGQAQLCMGFLEGHEIECPLHQGRFDVRSGQPTCGPATEPLRCYPVRLEAGRVWVQLG
jgi:naphthalene 1,2-dioxygenase ferredoxin component